MSEPDLALDGEIEEHLYKVLVVGDFGVGECLGARVCTRALIFCGTLVQSNECMRIMVLMYDYTSIIQIFLPIDYVIFLHN